MSEELKVNQADTEEVKRCIADVRSKITDAASDRELLVIYNTQLTELLRKENLLLEQKTQLRQAADHCPTQNDGTAAQVHNQPIALETTVSSLPEVPGRPTVRAGAIVKAKWEGAGVYPAKIMKVRSDGILELRWLEGWTEAKQPWADVTEVDNVSTKVDVLQVKRRQEALARRSELREGARVRARWQGTERWAGKIGKLWQEEGLVEVVWDDGGQDWEQPEHIETEQLAASEDQGWTGRGSRWGSLGGGGAGGSGGAGEAGCWELLGKKRKGEAADFAPGTLVRADWKGCGRWPATVRQVQEDGTVRVRWVDGEEEEDVAPDKVEVDVIGTQILEDCRVRNRQKLTSRPELQAGARVLVRSGGSQYFRGRIASVQREDGTLQIKWDVTQDQSAADPDDVELAEEVELALGPGQDSAGPELEPGTVVQVPWHGGAAWPAKVVQMLLNGRVLVRWMDEGEETTVAAEKCKVDRVMTVLAALAVIRRKAELAARETLRQGARVRCVKGENQGARVGEVRGDEGLLQIMWDGGGYSWMAPHEVVEDRVAQEAMAKKLRVELRVGDAVRARWNGGEFYPATMVRQQSDGKVLVRWDDQSGEEAIPRAEVELDAAATALEARGRERRRLELAQRRELHVGASVMVRYKGGAYQAGRIERVRDEEGMVEVRWTEDGGVDPVLPEQVEALDP